MPDPFDTLGVEPRFDLDVPALEQRHRDLSRALHPDRYTGAPAAERRLALGRAIDANEAFRALKDPVRRAEALLVRAGVPVGETREPKPPASLLMEMMEVREELSDAARAKDLPRVAALAATMEARRASVIARLGTLLAPADPGSASGAAPTGDLHAALPALGELRYIRRFLDEVAAIQDDLAP